MFFGGLAGISAELIGWEFFGRPVDPSLPIIFAGMMGLTAFLPKDKDEE